MRILFERNVVLDVLLNRQPHAGSTSQLMVHVEKKRIDGLLGATTVTTIHYLAMKAVGASRARKHVQTLLSLFEVAPVGQAALLQALTLRFDDYEDAVLHETALSAGAEGIVTRDATGFSRGTLRIYAPDELLRIVSTLPEP